MSRTAFLVFFCLSLNDWCSGQVQINGEVLSYPAKTPIAFANIGVVNSTVGTITNQDGTFAIEIPGSYLGDTLLVSALGYGKKVIPVKTLPRGHVVIYLSEKILMLEPVTVVGRKEKKKSFALGNRYTKGGFLYADSVSSGAAMALLIENKYPAFHKELVFPVFLEKAVLFIDKNSLSPFRIRVRIMEHDTITGLPGRDLLTESVVETSSMKYGWLDFDLRPFNMKVDRSFFLVFEWIMEEKDRLALLDQYLQYRKNNPDKVVADTMIVRGEKIGFRNYLQFSPGTHFGVSALPFSLRHYKSYYRLNSFAEWRTAPVILTARISVSNQPFGPRGENDAACRESPEACATARLCEQFIQDYAVNGMQLAVSRSGKTEFSRSYGYADAAKQIRVTADTRFRIGSVSKSLTSAALIRLVALKKLDLDAPVETYLQHFPGKKYAVTTRQLAGHISGFRHYYENDQKDLVRFEHYNSAREATQIFINDTLLFRPGSRYLYSSFGWNLIGAIVESIADERYLDFMQKNVWGPLNMTNTYGDVKDSTTALVSQSYSVLGEELERDDVSYKYPSGGLVSTATDLLRFGNELLHPKYLDPALTAQLFQPLFTDDGKSTHYGLGWNVSKDKHGHRVWFHAGNLPGGSALLVLYPDDDLVIAFLSNTQEGLLFEIERVAELYFRR
jgi:CubicO group peptidase (beta-lactamase class C family)